MSVTYVRVQLQCMFSLLPLLLRLALAVAAAAAPVPLPPWRGGALFSRVVVAPTAVLLPVRHRRRSADPSRANLYLTRPRNADRHLACRRRVDRRLASRRLRSGVRLGRGKIERHRDAQRTKPLLQQ